MNLIIFLLLLFTQTEVPYKAKEEFEIKLDYQFKQRLYDSRVYRPDGESIRSNGVLPYLILNLKVLKVGVGEVRYKIFSNLKSNIVNKRLEEGSTQAIDVGFTDDVKDRVTAHDYTIVFLSENKETLSRIFIHIAEDGSFFVNGEKRGKF